MGHDPAKYWKSFGSFSNETTKAIDGTTGDSAKKQNGNKYDEQVGHAVAKQVGNKSAIQTGWSNSVLQGFSFSTTLGQSTSTTVGNSFTNHTGFKWGMFVGPETSINAATSVKVTKGWAASFDTVEKCETAAQKIETALKKTEIATALTRTIGQEISTYTGIKKVIGGQSFQTAMGWDLTSSTINLYAPTSFNCSTTGTAVLSGVTTKISGVATLTMTAKGPATLNGAVIRIG